MKKKRVCPSPEAKVLEGSLCEYSRIYAGRSICRLPQCNAKVQHLKGAETYAFNLVLPRR